jgi:H+-translocating NAD(P) transhydrogenase subunit alpha
VVVRIAVPREVTPGESRVALTPEVVQHLVKAGDEVAVEEGAGTAARYPDSSYTSVGARTEKDRAALFGSAQILLKVQPPTLEEIAWTKPGTIVVALMNASRNLDRVAKLRDGKVTTFALELLPRITRAEHGRPLLPGDRGGLSRGVDRR